MNDHELELEIAKQAAIHVKEPVRNGQLLEALKELRSTRTQLERERMCHAACGVIAMSNTPESLERNRQMHPDYLSGSVQDCIKAAEREIALRSAIEEHHDQKADDRCWLDDLKLYAAAGLEPADNTISNPAAMLENCKRFIECRMKKGNWPTYQQLEASLEAARAEVAFIPELETKCAELEKALDAEMLAANKSAEKALALIAEARRERDTAIEKLTTAARQSGLWWANEAARCHDEITRLTKWKEEALVVMPDFQRIGNLLGLEIGRSVHNQIIPGIERLIQERGELEAKLHEITKALKLECDVSWSAQRERDEALTLAGLKDQSAKDLRTHNNNLIAENDSLKKRLAEKPSEKACQHEWYQGKCIHCEVFARDIRLIASLNLER